MNSDKYLFKKKLNLKRKSKRRLFTEFAFLFSLSLLLVYVNYLIPNKILLLKNLTDNLNNSLMLMIDLVYNLFEVFLIIYFFASSILALILMVGSFYRLFRIFKRKTKQISYK